MRRRLRRRLKPRLHKQCPPPRTKKENKPPGFLQPVEAGFVCIDAVSTARFSVVKFYLVFENSHIITSQKILS